jgi:hypothetical protein
MAAALPPGKSIIEEFLKVASLAKPLLPTKIEARDAILQMKNGGSKNWKQLEWIGFWFEYFVESEIQPTLGNITGPTYGNTTFDLQIDHVWDLKAHPNHLKFLLLNDQEAVNLCIEEKGGVGFIVVDGLVEYDDDNQTFKKWHDDLKGEPSNYVKARIARKAPPRRRKISFAPVSMLGIWINSVEDLIQGQKDGWISGFQTNMRNSNGKPRRSKFKFDTSKIPELNRVGEIQIH